MSSRRHQPAGNGFFVARLQSDDDEVTVAPISGLTGFQIAAMSAQRGMLASSYVRAEQWDCDRIAAAAIAHATALWDRLDAAEEER